MNAKIDICLTRSQVEKLSKIFADNPSAPSVTVGCTVDIEQIKFCDSYTSLVCGTEICSTTALVRCK